MGDLPSKRKTAGCVLFFVKFTICWIVLLNTELHDSLASNSSEIYFSKTSND